MESKTFKDNPNGFIENKITKYVLNNPDNQLQAFDGQTIFDNPLIGFVDGDDEIFEKYREIIGDFHMTPRQALTIASQEKHPGQEIEIDRLSVISWALPIHKKTLRSMHSEREVPSLQWNHTRWNGQRLIDQLAHHLVSTLQELGQRAVAPDQLAVFKYVDLPNGLASNWSHRHIAYAAGLGTFSLSDGFITKKGIALRCGSVVTDAVLKPSPRTYPNQYANCLFYQGKSCQRCAKRCPADAINENGHDKKKCFEYLFVGQKQALEKLNREEGYIGQYLGCGLCQTAVPCEHQIPVETQD